jgi:hypothetical protein
MPGREQKIELYGKGYQQLTDALQGFPREMWDFKPSYDRWSIHEILIHIADSDANAYVKCRKLISQPGQPVNDYNQDIWSKALDYNEQSFENALELFKLMRKTTYILLRNTPENVWAKATGIAEDGIVTLDDWLDIYASHIPDHIKQMEKNYAAWQKQS